MVDWQSLMQEGVSLMYSKKRLLRAASVEVKTILSMIFYILDNIWFLCLSLIFIFL